jgi:hypothetical protein
MGLRVELTLPGAECGLRSAISATVQVVDGAWVMGPVFLNGAQVERYLGERPELRTLLEAELARLTGSALAPVVTQARTRECLGADAALLE